MNYLPRITINPDICFGKPCIRGMRWPVAVVSFAAESPASGTPRINEPRKETVNEYKV